MAFTGLKDTENGIIQRLNQMISDVDNISGYLNRIVYPQYQAAQIERWKTEGSSEGIPWASLNKSYQEYKKRKYASYSYGGTKMLIATGKLFDSVVKAKKIVKRRSIEVYTTNEYAKYVDEERDFTSWSKSTMSEIKKGLIDYISGSSKASSLKVLK